MNESMRSPPDPASSCSYSLVSVRVFLALLALLSCAPAFVHYRLIEPHLEATRLPWGLLPAPSLGLRWLGNCAVWFPILFVALLVTSFFRPALIRLPLVLGIAGFLVFLVAYVCSTLPFVRSILLHYNA